MDTLKIILYYHGTDNKTSMQFAMLDVRESVARLEAKVRNKKQNLIIV